MNTTTTYKSPQYQHLKLSSICEAIRYFQNHRNDYTPRQQSKIDRLINKRSNDGKLINLIGEGLHPPVVIVQDDTPQIPKNNPFLVEVDKNRDKLDRAIRGTGVFEIHDNYRKQVCGTGWLVSKDLVVTNAHVAEKFFVEKDGEFQFRPGCEQVTIDFKEEHGRIDDHEFRILKLIHIELGEHCLHQDQPDIAILQVEETNTNGDHLPQPLPLYGGPLKADQLICVIGFPSDDPKLAMTQKKIFRNIYNVKRVQPGAVQSFGCINANEFKHNCPTLMGNSGSPVIDLLTGGVVGVHFCGITYDFIGCAVRTEVLREVLQRLAQKIIR